MAEYFKCQCNIIFGRPLQVALQSYVSYRACITLYQHCSRFTAGGPGIFKTVYIKLKMSTVSSNTLVNKLFGKAILKNFFDALSYSQEGEDKILDRFFEHRNKGFFVDVGAHDPIRFSNTYKFYLKGWRGINIDAMPGSMHAFNEHRPSDTNIEAAISDKEEVLTYYAFNEPALNGFSKALSDTRDGQKGYKIIFTKEIRTQRLSALLEQHVPRGTVIDFMSVDVEGLDLNVLQSNDWINYRPQVLLVEITGFDPANMAGNETAAYLDKIGYKFLAKTINTVLFADSQR